MRDFINTEILFKQLTADNLEDIASLTRGAIKGLKLPREQQIVAFSQNGEEQRLEIGNYLMIIGKCHIVIDEHQYRTIKVTHT